jgi:hypothetical protein
MALSADSARLGATTDRTLNKLAFAVANKASDITTATTSDIIPMIDVSADYEVKYADSANVFELMGITATAAEINAAADAGSRFVNVTDAASYSVLAADSGKIHIVPDLSATCTMSLPAVASGLEYIFISKAVAADAQDWKIKSASATNFFLGGVSFADTDAGAGADEIHAGIWSNGSTNDFLNIVTPGAGTRVHVICDGTNWIVNGQVFSATVPAFADT